MACRCDSENEQREYIGRGRSIGRSFGSEGVGFGKEVESRMEIGARLPGLAGHDGFCWCDLRMMDGDAVTTVVKPVLNLPDF